MVAYIIDTYAWIEYFLGGNKGDVLKEMFLDEAKEFFTVECCLAEIRGWSLKNNKDFEMLLKIIKANSSIMHLTEQDWIKAGEERHEQRKMQKDFGLIDAVIVVKQKEYAAKVISGDLHFKALKNVIFLE